MVAIETVEVVRTSYGRCLIKEGFWDKFYDNFLASSDIIAKMFVNTDLTKQKEVIKTSLNFVISYAKDPSSAFTKQKLEHVGDVHSKGNINVSPDLYQYWENSLLQTISEYDDQFNDSLKQQWQEVLSPAIELLKSRY